MAPGEPGQVARIAMDTDPTSQSSQAIDFGAPGISPSLNGYGSSGQDEPDVLVLIGAAFVGGLLLAVIVGRIAS